MVFVVDASRSMDKCDVIDQGVYKKRIEAVLDACFDFIKVRFQFAGHSNFLFFPNDGVLIGYVGVLLFCPRSYCGRNIDVLPYVEKRIARSTSSVLV